VIVGERGELAARLRAQHLHVEHLHVGPSPAPSC
jgi:hypothetical protein